jgi:2-methylcitrate dehydratase PrpD
VEDLVIDTLAVTAWGSRRPELAALRATASVSASAAGSTVLGTPLAQPAAIACALNGSAAAADQLQDGHRRARGHPASHVVLAVLALAEERDHPTEAMLSAILAGYEVGARLGIAMDGTPGGVHDIGTWGAAAATVGTAHLLSQGDPDVITRAIELSASCLVLSDAATVFGGHDGGHAFLGASISHGLWLGQSAAAGLSAAPGALERFLGRHAAAHWRGLPEVHGDEWNEYEIVRGYIKLHPACAHLHGVLDAVDDIARTHADQLPAEAVESVRVRTYAAASQFGTPARNELEARFSIPTAVALALRHGHLTDEVLTDGEVGSPATRQLADRVEVTHDPELDAGYPAGRPTTVEIRTVDGRTWSATSTRPRGDSDGDRSRAAFREKVTHLLSGIFGKNASEVLNALAEWPAQHTPRELGALLRRAARGEVTP